MARSRRWRRGPAGPPGVVTEDEQQGGDQDRADQQRVDQDADGHRDADLGHRHRGQLGQGGEGGRHDDAGRGDHATGDGQAMQDALPGAHLAGLLADPRGQEDVVVHAQGDQEDEDVQRQLGLDAVEAERVAPQQAREAERGGEAERRGGDQDQRGHNGPQQQADDDPDYGQDQRDEQQGVVLGGLVDVVEDGGGAPDRRAGRLAVKVRAQVVDGGVAGAAVRLDREGDVVAGVAGDRAGRGHGGDVVRRAHDRRRLAVRTSGHQDVQRVVHAGAEVVTEQVRAGDAARGALDPGQRVVVDVQGGQAQGSRAQQHGRGQRDGHRAPGDAAPGGGPQPGILAARGVLARDPRPEGGAADDQEQGGQEGDLGEQGGDDGHGADRAKAVQGGRLRRQQADHRAGHGAGRGQQGGHGGAQGDGHGLFGPGVVAQFLAVAVDEQQRVVGRRAEDQDPQDRRRERADGEPCGGQPVRGGLGHVDSTQRAEQRQQPQQRAA